MRIFTLILLLLFSFPSIAQVGIGTSTPDPSAILDIQDTERGVLFPRMTSSQRDAIVDPAPGLIVFNTDLGEIQINSNSTVVPVWKAFSLAAVSVALPDQSVKYSNTDITTDLNETTSKSVPLFGSLDWNDNNTLFTLVDDKTIAINTSGRYHIRANVSIKIRDNAGARQAPELRLLKDGSQIGSYASTGYIRRASGHEESSVHLEETIELTAGSTIGISTARTGGAGVVIMRSAGSSNIIITKVK